MDASGLIQAITFRLADALPADVSRRLAKEADSVERRKQVDAFLDAGYGKCWLARPELATFVEQAIFHFDGDRYRLLAWCIMPNHVHALIETRAHYPLDRIVHSWKSFTAKQINKLLHRAGEIWQREYFDRYIRDDRHLQAAIEYIENNPVKAGLVASAKDWRFSSACKS
jgi:putative DNA methylase